MAGCERCWAEAGRRMMAEPGLSKTEHYHDILSGRDKSGKSCTPAEQCGEAHVVLDNWADDRTPQCTCGKIVQA